MRWTEEEVEFLKDSYKDKTYKEIGEEIGRKTNAVKAKVYRLGLPDKTRKVEMLGKKIGRLTVVRETEKRSDKGSVIWECLCDCGGHINVPTSQLTFNKTTSCGCLRENMVGKNHPAYNPNLSDEDRRRKRYLLGEVWTRDLRVKVFERDNYACVSCNKKGGDMNAHHLNGWDMHVEQRFDINNLVTLCKGCHLKFHKQYGYGKNTKEQFEEFKAENRREV